MENFVSAGNTPIDNIVKNSSSEDSVIFVPPKDVSEENFSKALAEAVEEGKRIKKRKTRKRQKSPELTQKQISSESSEETETARGKKSKADKNEIQSSSSEITHVSETKSDAGLQISDGLFYYCNTYI